MRVVLAGASLLFATLMTRGASAHPCDAAGACPLGFWCESNVCVGDLCLDDSTCGAGFRCEYRGGTCKPQWQLACQVDTDCGLGFQCLPTLQECDCSSDGYVPDAALTPISCALPVLRACEDVKDCPIPQCDGGGAGCRCWTDYFCKETAAASHACVTAADCLSGWRCGCPSDATGDVDSGCAPSCQPPNDDFDVRPTLFGDDTSDAPDLPAAPVDDAGDASLGADDSLDGLPPSRHACSVGGGSPERGASALWPALASIAFGAARRRRRP